MNELGRADTRTYSVLPKAPVRIVLDDVRSRHNVGAIFRTADAFGLEGLDLCGITPCPPHRDIEKTALGATSSVPWAHHRNVLFRVRALQNDGYRVVVVEQTALARPVQDLIPSDGDRTALVFGNELHGVRDEVVKASDACIMVPQFGTKHSLNVSVCVGIVAWWTTHRADPSEP